MIQIENTPNPNALKFLSEKQFSEVDTQEFQKKDIGKIKNNFIKHLLNFDGIELILISKNFLSVKKNDKISWDTLKPSIISSINDYFEKNKKPIILKIDDKKVKDVKEDNEIVKKITDSQGISMTDYSRDYFFMNKGLTLREEIVEVRNLLSNC